MTMERRIKLKTLNSHITCKICRGYFIDATTVTECLHTCKYSACNCLNFSEFTDLWISQNMSVRLAANNLPTADTNLVLSFPTQTTQINKITIKTVSVCKSCLVKHLEENNTNCPTCNIVIHQSHPLQYISFDRTMQDIVYKLVPDLQDSEYCVPTVGIYFRARI